MRVSLTPGYWMFANCYSVHPKSFKRTEFRMIFEVHENGRLFPNPIIHGRYKNCSEMPDERLAVDASETMGAAFLMERYPSQESADKWNSAIRSQTEKLSQVGKSSDSHLGHVGEE